MIRLSELTTTTLPFVPTSSSPSFKSLACVTLPLTKIDWFSNKSTCSLSKYQLPAMTCRSTLLIRLRVCSAFSKSQAKRFSPSLTLVRSSVPHVLIKCLLFLLIYYNLQYLLISNPRPLICITLPTPYVFVPI